MKNHDLSNMEVGAIVAADFGTADVFSKFGIDFCCHGNIPLKDACKNSNVNLEDVLSELNKTEDKGVSAINFAEWPLDLLIDYVLKIHHRGIRKNGPEIFNLIEKVESVHGEAHPELAEIKVLFAESLIDLEAHLQKEEDVLFPFLEELYEASVHQQYLPQMHCGSVNNPISVMKMEHEGEGERYHHITEITNNFTAPDDACNSYLLMMERLHKFVDALYEHIHLENNIIFPMATQLEEQWVKMI